VDRWTTVANAVRGLAALRTRRHATTTSLTRPDNALATASVAAGLFAPAAALLYGLSDLTIGAAFLVAVALGCPALGLTLHVGGLVVLRRLRE